MRKEWVIDTCVLKQASEYEYDSMSFLVLFVENKDNILCIDIGEELLNQYKKHFNVHDGTSLIGSIWIKLDRNNRISYKVLGGLPKRVRKKLNKLKFDPDDFLLVEIAWESKRSTGIGRIVTVDNNSGDFDIGVREYLETEKIMVYDPKTAKDEL